MSSKNVKNAIKYIISSSPDNQTSANKLRESLFQQGYNISEANVKLALMRSKGELILENGMYKLGSNLLRSHESSKSHTTNTGSLAIYGFAEGSDVSITNKIFQTEGLSKVYTRNGVPMNIMLGSVSKFTGRSRKELYFDADGQTANVINRKEKAVESSRKRTWEFISNSQLYPSIEKIMISCSQMNHKMNPEIMKTKKILKSKKSKLGLDKKILYKHRLVKNSINQPLQIMQNSHQANIRGLKIKKVDSDVDWSVAAELNDSELLNMIREYLEAHRKWKEQTENSNNPRKQYVRGKQRETLGYCTYENCKLKTIPVYLKSTKSVFVDQFKHHVLSQHMNLINGQCQYCSLPITNNFRDHVRKSLVSQHHFRKHLPIELWPYSCSLCSEKFIYPHLLRDHIKTQHSGNQFCCFICGPGSTVYSRFRAATGRGGLAGHLQNKHDIFASSASWKDGDSERVTKINFKSKHNKDKAKIKLLKNYGYELDVEYLEKDFAINYNSDLAKLFDEKQID